MLKFLCVFLTITYSPLCRGRDDDVQFIADNNHDFDVLIFTQVWPVTGCISWMEQGHHHTCTLPSPKEIWTIHGVWPTRFGTIGPGFCNRSATFDVDTLRPFEDQLKQFWINIHKGTPLEDLWKHEWLKHGTCAAQLEELNNENKYFGQGLSWLQQYSMSSILQKGGILPDKSHTLISIHKAVVSALNKNPSIHCIYDQHRDEVFLDEIRICFDKSLTLVDCDGVVDESEVLIDYPGGKVITNCDLSKPILYPSVVPPSHRPEQRNTEWKFPFVNLYKLIEMIKWATL
ncbi:ribonuclease Oy isoform X2 [Bradysia coprophila]|uniref:ribonuclease Oy isoform X2 n=1 Tax=Bradysia coprophila TaxID=38358 RepID=UPI00187DD9C6|nr:ribonuclease Oy isoform X2 [Bradysia coprophila]